MTSAAAMQLYHWASAEHLFMARYVDYWIAVDTTQLTRKSWITRNRLRGPNSTFWFSPRVAHAGGPIPISQAIVLDGVAYCSRLLRSLDWYVGNAPFGREVYDIVQRTLALWDKVNLSQLNELATKAFMHRLELDAVVVRSSALDITQRVAGRGRLALHLAQSLKATSVVNPEAGIHLFAMREYERCGVRLGAYSCESMSLDGLPAPSDSGYLSWIDSASWLSPKDLRESLESRCQVHWLGRS